MPSTHLVLLLNQHQPLLRDLHQRSPKGAYQQPWVRLYAAKDYYQMAALLLDYPRVRLTFAPMPSLVWQLQDYGENGATDVDLELSATPSERLSPEQRAAVVDRFFRASFDRQILPSLRFTRLYTKRLSGDSFDDQELTDLQVWGNLCWVHPLLRETRTRLHEGAVVDLRELVAQDEGFCHADVEQVLEAHLAIMRSTLPVHRALAERGQVELATGPFFSPILPLLWNTDTAVVDRAAAEPPEAFARPCDARAQIRLAQEYHREVFGQRPCGLWPPEAALCGGVVDVLEEEGFEWTVVAKRALQPTPATSTGFSDTSLFIHPWRAPQGNGDLALFPRESWLSDRLESLCAHSADYDKAAADALAVVESAVRFGEPDAFDEEVVTVAVAGDHPWTSYRRNGIDFLRALYSKLSDRQDLATTTPHEYLHGSENRAVHPHPVADLPQLHSLRCVSRRDELTSDPGPDLGAWIGEREENEAWEILGRVAAELDAIPNAREHFPLAYQSLLAAEEADTFEFLGDDNDPPPGKREEHVALFRMHLENVYRLSERLAPGWLTGWRPAG